MNRSMPASLSVTNSQRLPKPIFIESVMPSNQLILCLPFPFLSSIFPIIRVFSNESVLQSRWPKYWSFSFSISPSNEYSGLISFRMDWLDLLAVQETLKSLLQHHTSKALILWHSAYFIVQLSHPYMTTGKTIALTRWTFSCVLFFATPWTTACQASLSITDSQSLLKLNSIKSMMPSNYLILCHPLLLPSIFPSIKVFSNESVIHISWPKDWSFSFSISPSNE